VTTSSGNVAADQLRSFVERIQRLTDDRNGIDSDMKDAFAEARGASFDVRAMSAAFKLRTGSGRA
jgi:uncharacterized protein (UPF0335 family)